MFNYYCVTQIVYKSDRPAVIVSGSEQHESKPVDDFHDEQHRYIWVNWFDNETDFERHLNAITPKTDSKRKAIKRTYPQIAERI